MRLYLAIFFITSSILGSNAIIKFMKIENCTTTSKSLNIERCQINNGTLNIALDIFKFVNQVFVSILNLEYKI